MGKRCHKKSREYARRSSSRKRLSRLQKSKIGRVFSIKQGKLLYVQHCFVPLVDCALYPGFCEQSVRGIELPKPSQSHYNRLQVSLVDCVLFPSYLKDTSKRPIRVLSLFDGIGSALVVLDALHLEVEAYFSCEIDKKAISVVDFHYGDRVVKLGDVRALSRARLNSLGRIDLLVGGSPCQDLSLVNPRRRGLHGCGTTGNLVFEYVRIRDFLLKKSKTSPENHNFYWLLENTRAMAKVTCKEISRSLGTDPVVRCASNYVPMMRPRYFWGNIPGMKHQPKLSLPKPRNLQTYLRHNRFAAVNRIPTVTSRNTPARSGPTLILPVVEEKLPVFLLLPELEHLFGFPIHYTDRGDLNCCERKKLLGNAWCIPVVVDILRPLVALFSLVSSEIKLQI